MSGQLMGRHIVNVAFRSSVFDSVGAFDPSLGRIGNSLLSGEEVELVWRVARRGGMVYYVPSAVVNHLVPVSRLTKDFFRMRIYWGARSYAHYELMHEGGANVARKALRGLIRFPYRAALSVYHALRRDGRRSSYREFGCIATLGYARELLQFRKVAKQAAIGGRQDEII